MGEGLTGPAGASTPPSLHRQSAVNLIAGEGSVGPERRKAIPPNGSEMLLPEKTCGGW